MMDLKFMPVFFMALAVEITLLNVYIFQELFATGVLKETIALLPASICLVMIIYASAYLYINKRTQLGYVKDKDYTMFLMAVKLCIVLFAILMVELVAYYGWKPLLLLLISYIYLKLFRFAMKKGS